MPTLPPPPALLPRLLLPVQVPVIANNRVGEEVYEKSRIRFYGGSFISGQHGEVLAQVRVSGCATADLHDTLRWLSRLCIFVPCIYSP
jgi:predicted amidohydrolase